MNTVGLAGEPRNEKTLPFPTSSTSHTSSSPTSSASHMSSPPAGSTSLMNTVGLAGELRTEKAPLSNRFYLTHELPPAGSASHTSSPTQAPPQPVLPLTWVWPSDLRMLLKQSWFEIMEQLEDQLQRDISIETETLLMCKSLDSVQSIHSFEQSYFAYIAVEKELYQQDHTARALNGEIVSEFESDNSDSCSGATDILSTSGRELVTQVH